MAVLPVPVGAATNVPHPSAVLLAPVVFARRASAAAGGVVGAGGVKPEGARRRWRCCRCRWCCSERADAGGGVVGAGGVDEERGAAGGGVVEAGGVVLTNGASLSRP